MEAAIKIEFWDFGNLQIHLTNVECNKRWE